MDRISVCSIIILGLTVTLLSVSLSGNLLTLILLVENRFPFSLEIRNVSGVVYADANTIGYVFIDTPVIIESRNEGKLTLYVALTHTLDEFRDIYRDKQPKEIRADITVTVCRGYICLPIPLSKTVNAPEIIGFPLSA